MVFSTLKMEAAVFSEKLVSFYHAVQLPIPEACSLVDVTVPCVPDFSDHDSVISFDHYSCVFAC